MRTFLLLFLLPCERPEPVSLVLVRGFGAGGAEVAMAAGVY